jgi:hypothetical protein
MSDPDESDPDRIGLNFRFDHWCIELTHTTYSLVEEIEVDGIDNGT